MAHWSLRSLLLVVLLAAVFLAGVKFGRRRPTVDGPGPRAMAYVKAIRTSSDREACAIFGAGRVIEETRPGFLRARPAVRAVPSPDQGSWTVTFVDPSTQRRNSVTAHFGDAAIRDYVRKHDRGFELVAQ